MGEFFQKVLITSTLNPREFQETPKKPRGCDLIFSKVFLWQNRSKPIWKAKFGTNKILKKKKSKTKGKTEGTTAYEWTTYPSLSGTLLILTLEVPSVLSKLGWLITLRHT